MPRGVNQSNITLLEGRIKSLKASGFLQAVQIFYVDTYLEVIRGFRPKGLQLHFFKSACPIIPNSILELFFDVSPAQVSIVNTSRDVYVDVNWERFDMEADIPSRSEQMKIAQNMCYCLGYNGISSSNNNVPQIRSPRSSDLNDEIFRFFKETLLDAFQAGYSAMENPNVSGGIVIEDDEDDEDINDLMGGDIGVDDRNVRAEDVYVDGATNAEVEGFGVEQEVTVTDASVRNASNTFYYIGYQNANSGSLYNRSSMIKKFPITTSDDKVYVFYFAMLDQEVDDRTGEAMNVVYYYQLQWGHTRIDGGAEDQTQITTVAQLQRYFKNNTSRLSTTNTLNLFRLNTSRLARGNNAGTIRALSKKAQTVGAVSIDPTFFTSTPDGSTQFNLRSDEKMVSVNGLFKEILREQEVDESRRQAEIDSSQEVLEAGMDHNKLIAIQRQTFDRGFGVEIEGNFDEVGKGEVANLLSTSGFPTKSTGYHGDAPDGYWKLESDGSVDNDLESRGGIFEMVSPILKGEEGVKSLGGFLAILRSQGARTSPSAGTHIHFGWKDFGEGDEGFKKRQRLIVNYCVLEPFLLATQITQSRNRGYAKGLNLSPAKIKKLAQANSYQNLRTEWSSVGGGRGALHLKEKTQMGRQESGWSGLAPPTYEFRFPASNFESDTITNMVRLIEKIWSASIVGYVPHTVESSKPREAEEWLEDLLGQELYSFWKNRYRDLQSEGEYKIDNTTPARSNIKDETGNTLVSNKLIPKLNHW